MLLRVLPLLIALALSLAPSSQAAVFVAPPPPPTSPPSTSENACTAFFEGGSETRTGLLCHNDPVNNTDPFGLRPDTTPSEAPEISLDSVQTGLDVAGLIPGIGEFADLGSGLISLGRGDYVGAVLSAGAMIPIAGEAAGVGKLARKGEAAARRAENIAKGIQLASLGQAANPSGTRSKKRQRKGRRRRGGRREGKSQSRTPKIRGRGRIIMRSIETVRS